MHALGTRRHANLDIDRLPRTASVPAVSTVQTLHRQRRQKLINAREKTPEKLDLRVEAERENAGQAPVPYALGAPTSVSMVAGAGFEPATFGL